MSSAVISIRTTNSQPVRAVASLSNTFTSPIFSNTVNGVPSAGWAKVKIEGLAPNTLYYVRAEYNGVAGALIGQFRTQPEGFHSFTFGAGSCWNPGTSEAGRAIFTNVRDRLLSGDMAFFFHLGDIQYEDIQVEDLAAFRRALDPSVLPPPLGVVRDKASWFRSGPLYYMYDDHDAGGPDNGDGFDAGTATGIDFFRKVVPVDTFGNSSPTAPPYYSFVRGRVRFIVTDVRNDRRPTSDPDTIAKYAIGPAQEAWFKEQCLAAVTADQPIIWVNTKPWIDTSADSWGGYSAFRTALVNWMSANGVLGKICIVSGDMHALAFDNGTNSPGGIPVMHCAPLAQTNTVKGGPYSAGTPITTRQTQFGRIAVTDASGTGAVSINYQGISIGSSTPTTEINQTFSIG